jgi:hypothetical protein
MLYTAVAVETCIVIPFYSSFADIFAISCSTAGPDGSAGWLRHVQCSCTAAELASSCVRRVPDAQAGQAIIQVAMPDASTSGHNCLLGHQTRVSCPRDVQRAWC